MSVTLPTCRPLYNTPALIEQNIPFNRSILKRIHTQLQAIQTATQTHPCARSCDGNSLMSDKQAYTGNDSVAMVYSCVQCLRDQVPPPQNAWSCLFCHKVLAPLAYQKARSANTLTFQPRDVSVPTRDDIQTAWESNTMAVLQMQFENLPSCTQASIIEHICMNQDTFMHPLPTENTVIASSTSTTPIWVGWVAGFFIGLVLGIASLGYMVWSIYQKVKSVSAKERSVTAKAKWMAERNIPTAYELGQEELIWKSKQLEMQSNNLRHCQSAVQKLNQRLLATQTAINPVGSERKEP